MADKPKTPKILEELSQGSAKAGGHSSRQQQNARRRFLVVVALFVPLLGGAVYLGYQQYLLQQSLAKLTNENQQLSQIVSNQNSELSQLREEFAAPIPSAEIDDSMVREVEATLNSEIEKLQQQLVQIQTQEPAAAEQVNLDWKILEAEFLMRMANQKLQLEADIKSAILLLEDAEESLIESGNNSVLRLRRSLANDLSMLRGIEVVDTEGIYIRLSNLTNRVEGIDLMGSMRKNFESRRSEESTAVEIKPNASSFVDLTYDFLSSIFVWQKWEENPAATLVPGQETNIKQSLRLTLEQAQYALFSPDQELYSYSLANSKAWLERYAVTDTAVGQTMLTELNELSSININPSLPTLEGSLSLIAQLTQD